MATSRGRSEITIALFKDRIINKSTQTFFLSSARRPQSMPFFDKFGMGWEEQYFTSCVCKGILKSKMLKG